MINKDCFSNKWIKNKTKEINANQIIIERAIYAYELLGSLVEDVTDLVFKGGSSLMLLSPELKRLSIDIDIITKEKDKALQRIFNKVTKKGIFNRWEKDRRLTGSEIPKKHFRFYYDSPVVKSEAYVLLDILQSKSPYPKTIEKLIKLPVFEVEKEVKVTVPTVNSLTGDKLSAFAPKTIGIPYGKDKSMEIIKQLFDLGILFENITDLKEINKSYEKVAELEASFRDRTLNIREYLNDSIEASFLLCQSDFKGSVENIFTKELRNGIKRIGNHIVGGKYSFLNAREDASKVACLASLIKDRRLEIDVLQLRQNRKDIEKIRDVILPEEYSILNKLKSISPESFYLWATATKAI